MVMKTKVGGKAFVFGKNIDTDQIYPGRFVEYTDVEDIKKYAMYGADESFVKTSIREISLWPELILAAVHRVNMRQ